MTRRFSRRDFLSATATSFVLGGCVRQPLFTARYLTLDPGMDHERRREFSGARQLPPALEQDASALLKRLASAGWFEVLKWREATGGAAPDRYDDPRLYAPLYESEWSPTCDPGSAPTPVVRRSRASLGAGFGYFAGLRAIHPGRPELSALYHALASHRVTAEGGSGEDDYPTLGDLDTLESWIFALAPPLHPSDPSRYTLAVLAYEYREAALTPHRQYDDLVFSRTGIARIGQAPYHYRRDLRAFTNEPASAARTKEFAVTPARYGLFLAEYVDFGDATFGGYVERNGDERRYWVKPVRKVFTGDPILFGGTFSFGEQHRSEALRRLATIGCGGEHRGVEIRAGSKVKSPGPPPPLEIDRPPFLTISNTIAGMPQGPDNDVGKTRMVATERIGDSLLVHSTPRDLVRPAHATDGRLYFLVPPKSRVNRRYTSFKVLDAPAADDIDGFIENRHRGVNANRFDAPRNAPMFLNARYQYLGPDRESGAEREPEHLAGREDEGTIEGGGYFAALFEDSICDGCVAAFVHRGAVASNDGDPLAWARSLPVEALPAFSIVTAPDFFPDVGPADLDDECQATAMKSLTIGNTAPLSFTRLGANPALRTPGSDRPAFPKDDDPLLPFGGVINSQLQETVTSTVSRGTADADIRYDAAHQLACGPWSSGRSGYLADTASAFMFPGWDVTYVGDEHKYQRFLATYGLGSPFPEDVKLCAAGNGMWPVTAPDASRTFQGSLEPPRASTALNQALFDVAALVSNATLPPPTAMPLLDDELGVHPCSPARTDADAGAPGWDGEFGPYFEVDANGAPHVNYADIRSVDYVANVLDGRFDASRLRGLAADECRRRMRLLRKCVARMDGPSHDVCDTKYWLVVARRVDWRDTGKDGALAGSGLPGAFPYSADLLTPRSGVVGKGYLFVFARTDDANVQRLVFGDPRKPGPDWARRGFGDPSKPGPGWARNCVKCLDVWCFQIPGDEKQATAAAHLGAEHLGANRAKTRPPSPRWT